MADDPGLDAALCAITALNATQVAGLAALAAMTADEVVAFHAHVHAVWEANFAAVQEAKAAVRAALAYQAQVETRCGDTARRRFLDAGGIGLCVLSDDEQASIAEARAALGAAKARLDEAGERFKQGVTAEALEAAG